MEPDQPLSRAEAQALLAYVEATYRSVTATRRRIATAALAVAIVFGLLCAASAIQWAATRARIAAVDDTPLVEALGVEIPDPRPALERGQLRLQALVWQLASAGTGVVTLLFAALYALLRPSAAPPRPAADPRSGAPGGAAPIV